jgi:hypothetical protein
MGPLLKQLAILILAASTCQADQAAIQQAIDNASAAGGGVVTLPSGVTPVDRVGPAWCLDMKSNVTLRGHEDGTSVLKMNDVPDDAASRIINCGDDQAPVENIRFENFALDGNKDGQTYDDEHRAGIFLWYCSDVVIKNVRSFNHQGDGFQVYQEANRLRFVDSFVHDTNRAGIALTGDGTDITIERVRFKDVAVQSIDTEPPSTGGYTNVRIDDCDIETFPGKGFSFTVSYATDWRITNCRVQGSLNIIRSNDILVTGCTIYDGKSGAVYLNYASDGVKLIGNTLSNHSTDNNTSVIDCRQTGGQKNTNLSILNNRITAYNNLGVIIWGAEDVLVRGNIIKSVANEASGKAIAFRATDSMSNITVTANLLHSEYSTAAQVAGYQDKGISRLDFSHNIVSGTNPTIEFTITQNFVDVQAVDNVGATVTGL